MEQEDKEKEFQRLWRERQEELRGIIAVMGPPYSGKTRLAKNIGRWVKCAVLCIQDFFSPAAAAAAAAADDDIKRASDEEVVQHAFTTLCKVAHCHLDDSDESWDRAIYTVVIKSRFNSTFELQRLLDLVTRAKIWYGSAYPLLIIECRFANEYIWKQHFESVSKEEEDDCSWYRPGSWKEMEKVRDDYYHPQSQSDWDLHLQQLILKASIDLGYPIVVRRLVVDPIDIFSFSRYYLSSEFQDAIKFLLTAPQGELINISKNTVEFHELRPHLFEKRLSAILAAKGRSDDLCLKGECIFKYWEELIHNHVCGVCDKQVDSGTPAYACRLCILTLHKSCAERIRFKALRFDVEFYLWRVFDYHELMPEKHPCKPCVDGGKGFDENCGSCVFQTHLKCGAIPTIINHNSHPPHFLSLLLTNKFYRCRACGEDVYNYSYCCKKCGLYYHLECALLPLELLKHKHGGHEHVMKLMYSHLDDTDDDMEPQESYWCEVCYQDMDPQAWLYSCKDCPYYAAHLGCAHGYHYLGYNVKNAKFVQQIQSQLEDAMADSELHEESASWQLFKPTALL